MRFAILFLLFIVPQLNAQQASFGGTVIDAITKEPMAGVHVTLMLIARFPEPNQPYGAISGPDGRFSIPNLPPDNYQLLPRHNGFLYLQDENKDHLATRITLKAGESVSGRTVEMTPTAIISGRVVDEAGDPVERAFVHASAIGVDASMSPTLSRMLALTDERGNYRITGAPGKFHVAATIMAHRGSQEIRTDGSEIPVYAETWFPGSESEDRGTVVNALARHEATGIDIHLVRKRSFTISGVVTGTPEGAVQAEIVANTKFFGLPVANADAGGRFGFAGLSAGQYTVWAHYQSGSLQLNSAPVEVPLEASNETSLNLKLAPGEELSGTLAFERDPSKQAATQRPGVHLEPITSAYWPEVQGGQTDQAGKFSFSSVFPAKYRVRVESMPESAFLKSVSVDEAPLPGDVIDLSRGVNGAKIKIAISLNGASVEGAVSSENGKPACCAMVAIADSIEHVNDHMMGVEGGKTYRFTGLRPGKYRLIVSGPQSSYGTQAAEELFSQAPEIELHEGEHITRDVTFKPRGVK